MDPTEIKRRWEEEGVCIIPGFIETPRVERLRSICDSILDQWFEAEAGAGGGGGGASEGRVEATNMAFLTDPVYFKDDEGALVELLELIADESILGVLHTIAGHVASMR